MKKNISVKSVRYIIKYKLEIEFSDKKSMVVDFELFLKNSNHPNIVRYLDLKKFRKFKIEHGELMWGDFDLLFPIQDLYRGEIQMGRNKTHDAA